MRYSDSFDVASRRQTAFDYVADGANSLPLHPAGTSIVREPPGEIALGTRFVIERPREPRLVSTITRFDRPAILEFMNAFDGQRPTRALWRFDDIDSGTRLSFATESSFVGPRWLAPLASLLTLAAWPLLMIKMRGLKRNVAKGIEATESGSS